MDIDPKPIQLLLLYDLELCNEHRSLQKQPTGERHSGARASTLEGQSLCLVCESVIRLANKTSVSTEINRPRILHAIALVPVCESRVDRGQRGFSALAWYAKECDPASG